MHDPIPTEALEALPVFPLPDIVLFPGAVLPLHIFERRYREMARDILAGHGLIALARLRPGYEDDYEGRPPIHQIAGVGTVLASDRLEDGRYNLLVRGIGRVRLDRELHGDRLYRVAQASPLADLESSRPQELAAIHKRLIELCDRLADFLAEDGEKLRQLARACDQPGGCVDLVAAALVVEPDARQALLEMLDPADRADCVTERVKELIAVHGCQSGLPN